jgi:RHS repeat-associated protein
MVETIDSLGNKGYRAYDQDGNLTVETDANGNHTYHAYDAAGRETATWNDIGQLVQKFYDANGHMTKLIDPDGNVTQFVYDLAGNLDHQIDPLGHVTQFQYDGDNRLEQTIDRDGRTKIEHYDGDRLAEEDWFAADGVATDARQWKYDGDGNITLASNSTGTYTFHYDSRNLLDTETEPFGITLSFQNDADGNQTSVQDSFGGTLTSVYDANNRLQTRSFSDTAGHQLSVAVSWNADNQITNLNRYADASGTNLVGSTQYTYVPNSARLQKILHTDGSGGWLSKYVYSYDAGGRVTDQNVFGAQTHYQYDAANELTADGSQTHSYDGAGNRTDPGYTTGPGNQLLTDGTWNFFYDAEGNLTKQVRRSDAYTRTFQYDNANEMTAVTDTTADGTVQQQLTFKYDVFGNRLQKDVWTIQTGSASVQRFAYDQQHNAWTDLSASNALVTRRLYLDGMDALAARISASGDVAWYLTDRLGSVIGLADNGGNLIDQRTYDAFGNITSESEAFPNAGDRYAFTGRELDKETGDQNSRGRELKVRDAYFMQEDPAGFGGGYSNLHIYVGNDATNLTDPTGMWGEWLSDLWEKHKSGWGVAKERFLDGLDKLKWAASEPWQGLVVPTAQGIAEGGTNTAKGVANSVVETGKQAADFANGSIEATSTLAGAVVGRDWRVNLYDGNISNLGKASRGGWSNEQYLEYQKNVLKNVITVGAADQMEAGIQAVRGEISTDEASQRIGGAAIFQFGAAALAKVGQGQTPQPADGGGSGTHHG